MLTRRKFLKGLLVGATALAVPIDALTQLLPKPVRPPRMLKCSYSVESADILKDRFGTDVEHKFIKAFQEEIAKDIDEEIMRRVRNGV